MAGSLEQGCICLRFFLQAECLPVPAHFVLVSLLLLTSVAVHHCCVIVFLHLPVSVVARRRNVHVSVTIADGSNLIITSEAYRPWTFNAVITSTYDEPIKVLRIECSPRDLIVWYVVKLIADVTRPPITARPTLEITKRTVGYRFHRIHFSLLFLFFLQKCLFFWLENAFFSKTHFSYEKFIFYADILSEVHESR